jgi:hypothetical protein
LTTAFKSSTEKRYARGVRRYLEWCQEMGYQQAPNVSRPDQMSDRVTDFTRWMTTVKRYAVETVWTNIRAVELYMQRHGAEVSVEPAMGVVDAYRRALAQVGAATAPARASRG